MNAPVKSKWTPPPRPDWVAQLNTVGTNCGSPSALVDLSEESLLTTAIEVTGLTDFGPDSWRDGFRMLVNELDTDADLNLVGRIIVRAELIRSLRARLELARAYQEHPDIAEQKVEKPIFITGMGRSGTSVLHELLAEDPQFRVPLTWELLYPCPPPDPATRATDRRIAMAEADHTMWFKVCPEYRTMHDNRADGPNECILGTMHEFASQVWSFAHDVPKYDKWLAFSEEAYRNAFRFHRYLLQLLQYRIPGRWMLKAPTHLTTLGPLFDEYPDAHVIITHRDPLKTLPSVVSLIATMRRQRSDHVDYNAIVQMIALGYPMVFRSMMRNRDAAVIPQDRITDVRYADLMTDPVGTVGAIYEKLGMRLDDAGAQRIRDYLTVKPKDRYGTHEYSFDDMGLDLGAVRAAFRDYQQRYDVDDEA